ncbi:zinc knuckle, partial [Ostertagia ostertagi]
GVPSWTSDSFVSQYWCQKRCLLELSESRWFGPHLCQAASNNGVFKLLLTSSATCLRTSQQRLGIRALTDLRNLKIRPGQSIVDFCVVLESLGKKANPESTIEDRSMEYAQIVLENLKDWPEQVQILSALHSVEPRHAYDKIKELAISIEQANAINGKRGTLYNARPRQNWRVRASEYKRKDGYGEELQNTDRNGHQECTRNVTVVPERTQLLRRTHSSNSRERCEIQKNSNDSRKCYNCNRYGHIAWQCPLKDPKVRQVSCDSGERTSVKQSKPLTTMINENRSMGIKTERGGSVEKMTLLEKN